MGGIGGEQRQADENVRAKLGSRGGVKDGSKHGRGRGKLLREGGQRDGERVAWRGSNG